MRVHLALSGNPGQCRQGSVLGWALHPVPGPRGQRCHQQSRQRPCKSYSPHQVSPALKGAHTHSNMLSDAPVSNRFPSGGRARRPFAEFPAAVVTEAKLLCPLTFTVERPTPYTACRGPGESSTRPLSACEFVCLGLLLNVPTLPHHKRGAATGAT